MWSPCAVWTLSIDTHVHVACGTWRTAAIGWSSARTALPATADGLARRALILSFDGSDLIEIEYEKAEGAEEVVLRKRCQPLLPFEEKTGSAAAAADAETLKLNGNTLFKLRDAAAAIEQYVAGLKLLSEAPSAGARCLVRPADNPHGAVRSVCADRGRRRKGRRSDV